MAISKGLYNQLRIETKNRCGYSLTSTWVTGEPLTIEHIFPVARGGTDDRSNLWLSCRRCNQYKRTLTEATDPDTGQIVPFFNPRRQLWYDHFTWSGAWDSYHRINNDGKSDCTYLTGESSRHSGSSPSLGASWLASTQRMNSIWGFNSAYHNFSDSTSDPAHLATHPPAS